MCTSPEAYSPQACGPSAVITILATMLSGSLIPSRMARLAGSFTSSTDDCEGGGGVDVAAVLNALYSVEPSGEKMLPPMFCNVLTAPVYAKGALALFCCPTIASVAVSNIVNPAMNREPSAPTSTPCGAEVSATVCVARPRVSSITFSDAFPLLVTYRKLPPMDRAPASGVFPTDMVPTTWLVV